MADMTPTRTRTKLYKVTYELDDDGWWVASVPGLRGAHTQGRTLSTARARIREAIALMAELDSVDTVATEDYVHLRVDVADAVAEAVAARTHAQEAEQTAMHLAEEAAQFLLAELRVSTRDAGELLQISHGRAHQLGTGKASRSSGTAAKRGAVKGQFRVVALGTPTRSVRRNAAGRASGGVAAKERPPPVKPA